MKVTDLCATSPYFTEPVSSWTGFEYDLNSAAIFEAFPQFDDLATVTSGSALCGTSTVRLVDSNYAAASGSLMVYLSSPTTITITLLQQSDTNLVTNADVTYYISIVLDNYPDS